MEQRNDERKRVSIGAVIGCPRFGMIRGRIIDISMHGLYIRAETSIVPIGAQITVTFQPDELQYGEHGECMTVAGHVCHQSLQGFGVAFTRLDDDCRDRLGELLPAMPPVPMRAIPVLRAI